MKKRDIIIIIVSVVILVVVGALLYRYLAPPSSNSGIMVEVPHPVNPNFNQAQLNSLKNDVTDYSQNITPKDTGGSKPVIQ